MQTRGVPTQFHYEIFSCPQFIRIECTLWPILYYTTAMCESTIQGQCNRESGRDTFMHRVLSPVVDFAVDFEFLQYQYDRWLFKTLLEQSTNLNLQGVVLTSVFSRNPFLLPSGNCNTSTCSMQSVILPDHQPLRMDLPMAIIHRRCQATA